MKRKFVKVMFFGALALSTVTYVGCKDYDDDVKGLQEQIDNINKKGADVTTEAMNAAINSAIAKVQADLDKLAGKADKAALEALQTVVNNLQNAVNGKADSSKLESLKVELEAAIAKANAAIQPAVDAAKKNLEKQISDLEQQLEEADGKLQEQITNNLADLKSQLGALEGDVAREIAGLQAQLSDLSGLEGRIETLEAIKHLTTADVLDFIKTNAEVKEFVDGEFVSLLQQNLTNPESALLTYLTGTFTEQLMTKVEAKCRDIVTPEMNALREEWATYKAAQDESYTALNNKVVKLEEYKLDLMQELYETMTANNTLEELAGAIEDISTLAGQFASYTTTDALKTLLETQKTSITEECKTYTDAQIKLLDPKFEALDKKIEDLRSELGAMLKSLAFLPQYFNDNGLIRNVYLTSIFTKSEVNKPSVLISGKKEFTVRFRVSPASAAADLAAGVKYKITTDNHVVKTRGLGAPFTVKEDGVVAVAGEEGVIEVTLLANSAVESHAVALYVEGIDNATKLTKITSDYFGAIVNTKYLTDVKYSNEDAERDEYGHETNVLYSNGKNSLAFYTKDAPEYYALTLKDNADGTGATTSINLDNSSYDLPADLFSVAFKLFDDDTTPNDNEYFAWDADKTTLKISSKTGNLQKTCNVVSTVTVKATNGSTRTFVNSTQETVTIKAEGSVISGITLDAQKWNNESKTYSLTAESVEAIVAGVNAAASTNYVSLTEIATAGVRISGVSDNGIVINRVGNGVNITVLGCFVGEASPMLKFTFTNTTVVEAPVAVTVTAPVASDYPLANEPVAWDGSSVVNMIATPDNNAAVSSVTLSVNMTSLFKATEWTAINTAVAAGNIKIKAIMLDADGEVLTGNDAPGVISSSSSVYTYTNKATNFENAKVAFSFYWIDGSGAEQEIKKSPVVELTAPNMNGKLSYNKSTTSTPSWIEVPAAIAIPNKAKLIDVTNLQANLKWEDSRNAQMWPTIESSKFESGITAVQALNIYGLNMKYTVDEGSRATFASYFNTTGYNSANGSLTEDAVQTIQLSALYQGQEIPLASDIKVTIKVTASSKWAGEIKSTLMTITYPKGTTN